MSAIVARHLLGVWTRTLNWTDPPRVVRMLVWKNVWEVNGEHHEPGDALCAPLDECSDEERHAAESLPAWPPPDDDDFDFTPLGGSGKR